MRLFRHQQILLVIVYALSCYAPLHTGSFLIPAARYFVRIYCSLPCIRRLFVYQKRPAPMPVCGRFSVPVRVAKPVPCRSSDSGLVRRLRLPKSLQWHMQPARPLQRRVRAGFSPVFPLSRPPSGGTWNPFILFSTLSSCPTFVNLYRAFSVLVIFTNRKVDRLELHLVFMFVLLRKLWGVWSGRRG